MYPQGSGNVPRESTAFTSLCVQHSKSSQRLKFKNHIARTVERDQADPCGPNSKPGPIYQYEKYNMNNQYGMNNKNSPLSMKSLLFA
ncbi:hypothetical protein BTA51_13960 [Hahella sp. CCB-MM4]|nr:hypothetical protein BTA51_13960 [Hahella sp. CCB-MM4]